MRLGLGADLVEGDFGRELDEREPAAMLLVDGEDAQVGDDHVDDAGAGERQRAAHQELELVLRRVLHDDDDLLDLLNTQIRALPGVISTETLVYLRLVKQQYNWGTR